MGKILCGIITVVESWLCLSVQHNKEQGLCSVSDLTKPRAMPHPPPGLLSSSCNSV
uniref:Uncharacterized protein n=1 Tax=Setaria italica TaxID=4555 RepID=K3ZPA1_SETIT